MLTFKALVTRNLVVSADEKGYRLFYMTDDSKIINVPILIREWGEEKITLEDIRQAVITRILKSYQIDEYGKTIIYWNGKLMGHVLDKKEAISIRIRYDDNVCSLVIEPDYKSLYYNLNGYEIIRRENVYKYITDEVLSNMDKISFGDGFDIRYMKYDDFCSWFITYKNKFTTVSGYNDYDFIELLGNTIKVNQYTENAHSIYMQDKLIIGNNGDNEITVTIVDLKRNTTNVIEWETTTNFNKELD